MQRLERILALSVLICASPIAAAQTVTLPAAKDNSIYQEGSLSNGAGSHLFTGRIANFPGASRRALIAFDVAGSIPAGSTITSVRLVLVMNRTIVGAVNQDLHRLTTNWGEGPSNAPGQEGTGTTAIAPDCTWADSMLGTPWTTAGGDFVAVPSASATAIANGPVIWGSSAQLVADVQNMLDNPATNYGWMVIGDESFNPSAKRWGSRENVMAGERPSLTIGYTLPTPGVPFCFGVGCPCGNDDPTAGCVHSSGVGGTLTAAPGSTTSFVTDNLRLDATHPPGNSGLLLMDVAPQPPVPFFDGLNCVRGGPRTLPGGDIGGPQPFGDVDLVGGDGVRNLGSTVPGGGLYGLVNATFPGFIGPGASYVGQFWNRDVLCGPPPAPCPSPCGTNANFSHGLRFLVTP